MEPRLTVAQLDQRLTLGLSEMWMCRGAFRLWTGKSKSLFKSLLRMKDWRKFFGGLGTAARKINIKKYSLIGVREVDNNFVFSRPRLEVINVASYDTIDGSIGIDGKLHWVQLVIMKYFTEKGVEWEPKSILNEGCHRERHGVISRYDGVIIPNQPQMDVGWDFKLFCIPPENISIRGIFFGRKLASFFPTFSPPLLPLFVPYNQGPAVVLGVRKKTFEPLALDPLSFSHFYPKTPKFHPLFFTTT
ncbi:hypothetical protein CsSME_00032806 [Camellia sinensis var. sinensis]